MSDVDKKIAVVTGASSGIGRAICSKLAKEGMTICMLGRNIETLGKVKDEIDHTSPTSSIYQIDLTEPREIDDISSLIKKKYGHIDVLVHSAGVFSLGRVADLPVEKFDKQYQINTRAPYLLTQKLLSALFAHKGQIVFVNSTIIFNVKKNLSQYSATKFALKAVADSLRSEVNKYGIRVLTIYPGRTATPMQEEVCSLEKAKYCSKFMIKPETIATILVNALNVPSDAEITDIIVRPMHTK